MAMASPRQLPSSPLQRSPTFKDPNPITTNSSPLDSFASDPLFSPFLSPSSSSAFSSRALSSGSAASTAEHLQDAVRSLHKHLRSQVLSSHPSLLSHLSHLRHAHSLLSTLRKEISDPRLLILPHTAQLSNLHSAADLILSTSRLLKLSSKLRSLTSSTSKSLDPAMAAEMHREIETVYEARGLAGISVVEGEIRWLSEIGSHLRSEAIKSVERGMDEMNQNGIWCGLQVFYNLGELRSTVDALTNKYKGTGVKSVGSALDMKAISSTAAAGGGGFGGPGGS